MKTFKYGILFSLLLVVLWGCSPTTFYYRMAEPSNGNDGISFYRGPANDTVLKPVSGDEVRNVILCIGDGMGFNHVALSQNAAGVEKLWMETLPVRGQATTFSANKKTTDSAAAGTALACGIKTDNGLIGVTPKKVPYYSTLELLAQRDYKTGLVATSPITHATPASFASHVKDRGNQTGIAPQMLGNRVDVMLGGGRKYWLPRGEGGVRDDGVDWVENAGLDGYRVIDSRDELLALTQIPVLGLFGDDGLTTFSPEPMLAEMADVAINLLARESKGKGGFFLMIEGSQIDWAAHANDGERVIRQTLLFDMAVQRAIEFAKRDKHTLVIVTADHETGGLELKPDEDGGLKAKFTTGGHTPANVPIFAYGPGAEHFSGTIDNTDIPKRIAELTGITEFPAVKASAEQKAAVN